MAANIATVTNAINHFIATAAIDVIGVFKQDFSQVFSNARPLKVIVKPDSKLMEHPLEDGATTSDHRIILPTEVELSMILRPADYRGTYQQIKQLFLTAELLTVQTKADSFQNMVIMSIPHDEDPGMYDTIAVAIKLKEVLFANTSLTNIVYAPKNPTNSTTQDRGTQQGTTPTPAQQTGAAEAFDALKGII